MSVRWLHRWSYCRSERAAAVCLDTLGGVDRVEALRLTRGARLTQPDVRADGSIVAVQLGADDAQLVLVSDTGESILSITPYAAGTRWADPRWSPSFFAPMATRYHGRRWTPWALLRGRRGIPPAIRWRLPCPTWRRCERARYHVVVPSTSPWVGISNRRGSYLLLSLFKHCDVHILDS